jgi:hypothetical protein
MHMYMMVGWSILRIMGAAGEMMPYSSGQYP